MPNVVENKLTISANEKSFNEFKGLMGEVFSLEKILPTPQKLLDDNPTYSSKEDMDENYPPEWMKWRLQHWGVDRDIWNCKLTSKKIPPLNHSHPSKLHKYRYEFDSAWNAPLIALERLSKEIPELRMDLDYFEPMNDIDMKVTIHNGQLEIIS